MSTPQPTPPTPSHLPMALDLRVLDKLANHDATKIRKFALLFLQSMDEILGQLDTAIASQDLALLGAMGHRAKSTALNVGAADFSQQCLLLEQATHSQDSATALAIALELRPRYASLHAAITQHIAS